MHSQSLQGVAPRRLKNFGGMYFAPNQRSEGSSDVIDAVTSGRFDVDHTPVRSPGFERNLSGDITDVAC
jgi:hypothetical protein